MTTERLRHRESLEARLGFGLPPYRGAYEEWKTDYGIGIAGLHWVIPIMHLPAYKSAGFRTVAAAEILPERVAAVSTAGFDVGPVDDDFRKMIERPEVEVVDSCFGHVVERQRRRLELVEACAALGKHVMVHKPVASTLSLAEEMAGVARKAGIWLAVNQDCRYNPATYTVKQLLSPERLGRPLVIELQNYWQSSASKHGPEGPAWMQHLVHHADVVRWWVGEPCVSVYSKTSRRMTMSIYEFAGGTVAYHIESHDGTEAHETKFRIVTECGDIIHGGHNWNWHHPSPGGREFITVCRDKDEPGISLPLPEHVYAPPWLEINKWLPHSGPYYDLAAPIAGMMGSMAHLMRGVELGQPPDNHVDGAIESLRICLAAEISAQSGEAVNPADVPSDTTSVA